MESVGNWFEANDSVGPSAEVDEWVTSCTDVSYVTPISPHEAGRVTNWLEVDQTPPVRTQGLEEVTNRSKANQIPAVRAQGTGGATSWRDTSPSLWVSAYVAEVGPNEVKVNHVTPINGHVSEGVTGTTETNMAKEVALWLEAGTTPYVDPVVAKQGEATVNIGP